MNPRLHQSLLLFCLIHASYVTANIGTHRRVRSIKGESRMNHGEGIKIAKRNEAGWERSNNGKLRSLGEKDDKKGKNGKNESSESTDVADGKKKAMKGEGKSSGKGSKGQHKSPEKEVMTKKPKTGKEKGKGKKSEVDVKEKKEKVGKQTDEIMKGKKKVSPKEASEKVSVPSKVMGVKKEKKEMIHKETDDMLWKEVSEPPSPPEPLMTESPVPDPPAPSPTDSPTEAIVVEQPSVQPVMTESPVESPSASPDETDVPTCLECDDPDVN